MPLDLQVALLLEQIKEQGVPPFEEMAVGQALVDEIAAEILHARRTPVSAGA